MLLKFYLYPRRGTSMPVPTATITQALGSCRQMLTFSGSGSDKRTPVPTCSYKDYRKHGPASAWHMAGAPCSLKPNPNFIYCLKLEIDWEASLWWSLKLFFKLTFLIVFLSTGTLSILGKLYSVNWSKESRIIPCQFHSLVVELKKKNPLHISHWEK